MRAFYFAILAALVLGAILFMLTGCTGRYQTFRASDNEFYQIDTIDGHSYLIGPSGSLDLGTPQKPTMKDMKRDRSAMPKVEEGGVEL